MRGRLALLAALVALAGLTSCRRAPGDAGDAGEARRDWPPEVSVGTLQALGPHVFQATLLVKGKPGRPDESTTVTLAWSNPGRWWWKEREGGAVRSERVFPRASGHSLRGDGKYVPLPSGDALGDLQRTLVIHDRAIGPFQPRLAWESLGEREIEERAARGYRMILGPPAAAGPGSGPPGPGLDVVSLEGEVWVDVLTGNRLDETWEGRAVVRKGARGARQEMVTRYEERRTGIGLDPEIPPVPPDRIAELPPPPSGLPALPPIRSLPKDFRRAH